MNRYAIKVYFKDTWLYVSEGPIDELRVMLFTLEEAEIAANQWRIDGNEELVEVVLYDVL